MRRKQKIGDDVAIVQRSIRYNGGLVVTLTVNPAIDRNVTVDRLVFEDPASFHRTWLRDGELCERWHDLDTGNKKIRGYGCTLLVSGIYNHELQEHMD